jgi:hypothetical protein
LDTVLFLSFETLLQLQNFNIVLVTLSKDLTTDPMFLATPFIVTADWTLEATASTLPDILK